MDDDRMVKSAWTPEVRANAKDLSFSRKPARTRASPAREPARGGREGDAAHRWRNDPRGTGTRARVTSRGTFGATTTTTAAATTAAGDGNG